MVSGRVTRTFGHPKGAIASSSLQIYIFSGLTDTKSAKYWAEQAVSSFVPNIA